MGGTTHPRILREAFKKSKVLNLGHLPNRGGGDIPCISIPNEKNIGTDLKADTLMNYTTI